MFFLPDIEQGSSITSQHEKYFVWTKSPSVRGQQLIL